MNGTVFHVKRMKHAKTAASALIAVFVLALALLFAYVDNGRGSICVGSFSLSGIPEFSDSAYVELNNNTPYFDMPDTESFGSFEKYGARDSLGRCTAASACIGKDLMSREARGNISGVFPTGWQNTRYGSIPGGYLYNRCHLIGVQLTGENANEDNLITGTRYMNISGMLPFENAVADYVKETGNHVLYRVTPVFSGDELLARGLIMEALSAEDGGEGICFCVYVYNCQPGVAIDYRTGENAPDESETQEKTA